MKNPIKGLITLAVGYAGGLLLAKKTGKTLRKELSKSENPAKTMLEAMKEADLAAFDDVKDWWANSEKIQSLVKTSKEYFEDIADDAKEFGEEAVEKTTKELERVSKDAKNAAEKLKKQAVKKGTEVKKKATKFKNDLEKKVKTIAKK